MRAIDEGLPVESVTESMESALTELMVRLLGAGAMAWATTELTMPQLKVLLLLSAARSASISWLAAQTSVSTPNVTGIVDRLEERGWAQRRMDARDRRVVQVSLTDHGHTLLREGCRKGVAALAPALQTMQPQEALMLRAGITALLAVLDANAGAAGEADGARIAPRSAAGDGG